MSSTLKPSRSATISNKSSLFGRSPLTEVALWLFTRWQRQHRLTIFNLISRRPAPRENTWAGSQPSGVGHWQYSHLGAALNSASNSLSTILISPMSVNRANLVEDRESAACLG